MNSKPESYFSDIHYPARYFHAECMKIRELRARNCTIGTISVDREACCCERSEQEARKNISRNLQEKMLAITLGCGIIKEKKEDINRLISFMMNDEWMKVPGQLVLPRFFWCLRDYTCN